MTAGCPTANAYGIARWGGGGTSWNPMRAATVTVTLNLATMALTTLAACHLASGLSGFEPEEGGVYVSYYLFGSPAHKHKLVPKNWIVGINGERVPVKSFAQYVALHDGLEPPAALEKVDDRWTVGVAPSDGTFQHLSFVNSICTSKGGSHVNYVADQITAKLAAAVKKKNKGQEVKPAFIKAHLCVYVDAMIVNPSFDSQTKETLTTKEKAFGSKCALPDKFLKAVEKSGVVDRVLAWT